jgi:LysM repeat protein
MRSLAITVILLTAGAASASERIHTVAPGDSAPSLAKKYYGNRDLGDLLLRYNGKAGKMIHPGDRLTVPFCEVYEARPGDTWSAIAKRLLGRTGAGAVLAHINGHAPEEPLRVGTRIVVPVVVRHTLARGESLSSLAQRFYGDTRKAGMIREFGRIKPAQRVAVGTALEIPTIAFLKAEPPKMIAARPSPTPEPVPSAPPAPLPPPAPPVEERRFVGPLGAAERYFADGEYDRAREMLEALRDRVSNDGSPLDRRDWGRLLAFTYIALDRDEDACAVHRSSSSVGPPELDPDLISPRIRSALSKCAGASSSLEPLDNPGTPSQISPHAGTRG